MKPDPETLLSAAKGTIPEQPFTGNQNGLLPRRYFAGKPIYERLWSNEYIHYLLVNRSSGVVVNRETSSEPVVETPSRGFRAVAAVTDQRVLFVVGQRGGDWSEEVGASDIKYAMLKSGFFKTDVGIETETATYTFSVNKHESTSASDAVRYIRKHLVPIKLSATPEKTTDSDQKSEDSSVKADDEKDRSVNADLKSEALDPSESEVGVLEEDRIRLPADSPRSNSDPRRERETNIKTETNPETESEAENSPGTIQSDDTERQSGAAENGESTACTADEPKDRPSQPSDPEDPSRSELIAELHRIKEQINTAVQPVHVRRHGRYQGTTFLKEFGDWEKALNAAFSGQETVEDEGTSASSNSGDTSKLKRTGNESARNEFVAEIERVARELEKRPTMSEFDAHSKYDSSDVYDYFGGWEDAIDAAEIDFASRQKLLSELHRLESQLGFVPLSSHVDGHSQFSAYDYRVEFGSVDEALEKAGLDPKVHVMEALGEVVANADHKPRMADFEEASPYSQAIIYKYFDSWDDAIATARSEIEAKQTSEELEDDAEDKDTTIGQEPKHNELSERYELLRNLRTLVTAVVDPRDEKPELNDPMVDWASTVESFWNDGPTGAENYGTQQNERNPFSMQEYRRAFGDGTRVTEFEHVTVRPLSPSVGGLLAPLLPDDPSTYDLPVDPDTGVPLPVIVESQDELRRARGMLRRLPLEPEAAMQAGQPDTDETDDKEEPRSPTTTGTDELLDVSGVTENIAHSLCEAGYATRNDLREASIEELTTIDGVNEQVVMRIKLDVGE